MYKNFLVHKFYKYKVEIMGVIKKGKIYNKCIHLELLPSHGLCLVSARKTLLGRKISCINSSSYFSTLIGVYELESKDEKTLRGNFDIFIT